MDFFADLDTLAECDYFVVGWCRLTASKPRVDTAWCQRLKLKYGDTGFKLCFQFQLAPLHRGDILVHHEPGGVRADVRPQGRAVQVDPIKPTLKAPGAMRLKLIYVSLLSSSPFKFNLRRYSKGTHVPFASIQWPLAHTDGEIN
jgi:hypothetical protein